jgi:serine protease Do
MTLHFLKTRTYLMVAVVVALAGALAAVAMTTEATAPAQNAPVAAKPTSPGSGATYANTLSQAFREAADHVLPSVVMIRNEPTFAARTPLRDSSPDEEPPLSPFGDLNRHPDLRRFFEGLPQMPNSPSLPQMPSVPKHGSGGIGSGVIIDPSGIILTNNHVVAGGGKITVRLHDGREFNAADVKGDEKSDLAIVRIQGAGPLTTAKLGDSDSVEIGDWVLALGQPFGLEGTVTAGIVSAKHRGLGIAARENYIQTDAAINPGSSGGPLVNLDGEVVAINSAISTRTGGYQGVGFAVPINLAKWVSQQLVERGAVKRAYLGVMIQPVSHELAGRFGVKAREGVLVTEVQPNTPAARAGLQPGDVIVEFNGQPVVQPNELQGLVERVPVNGRQSIVVVRGGNRVTLNVTCDEQPAEYGTTAEHGTVKPEVSQFDKLGLEVEALTPDVAKKLGMEGKSGVVITDIREGSPADEADLAPGMLISQANHKNIKSVEDFRQAITDKSPSDGLLLLVRTADGSRFVVVKAEK